MSINKSFNQCKFAVYIELNKNKPNCKKINPLEKVENVMKCTYSVSVIRFKRVSYTTAIVLRIALPETR